VGFLLGISASYSSAKSKLTDSQINESFNACVFQSGLKFTNAGIPKSWIIFDAPAPEMYEDTKFEKKWSAAWNSQIKITNSGADYFIILRRNMFTTITKNNGWDVEESISTWIVICDFEHVARNQENIDLVFITAFSDGAEPICWSREGEDLFSWAKEGGTTGERHGDLAFSRNDLCKKRKNTKWRRYLD